MPVLCVGGENKALPPIIRLTINYMSVTVSSQLKKESIKLDRNGNIIERSNSENKNEEMKRKQEERARKLGFK